MALLVEIDRESATPIYRQIVESIVERIERGALSEGDRLPPSRTLARRTGVNRSTVYRAYEELWALGYIESRPGSYSTVRRRTPRVSDEEDRGVSLIEWSTKTRTGAEELWRLHRGEERLLRDLASACPGETVDFASLSPDTSLFPSEEYRKCLNTVLVQSGAQLLSYGDPRGYAPLRRFIAGRMRLHGIHVREDEILITAGAQSAIDLIFRAFSSPGETVLMETPTYSRVLGQCRLYGTAVVSVGMDEEGMIPAELDRALNLHEPAFLYTIPNFHNPTGITAGQSRREEILSICERRSLPIVEDGFEEEMKYFGKEVLPIKSMDRHGTVLYLGTFSKVLFPGLRIGWVAAESAAVQRLASLQKYCSLCTPQAEQAALALFCEQGLYDAHIRRMHRVYKRRMQQALSALERLMPDMSVSWTNPSGGYTLWLDARESGIEEDRFLRKIASKGVLLLPGSSFFTGGECGPFFRMSVGTTDERQIERGVSVIAETLKEMI